MVELGSRQRTENEAFAGAAAHLAAALVVVGRTNLAALPARRGARRGRRSCAWRRGSARSSGCAPRSRTATPSSTRTTCPTTTLSRPRRGDRGGATWARWPCCSGDRPPSTTSASSPGSRRAASSPRPAATSSPSTGRRPGAFVVGRPRPRGRGVPRRRAGPRRATQLGARARRRVRSAGPARAEPSPRARRGRAVHPRRPGGGRHAAGRARPRRRAPRRPVGPGRGPRHGQARLRGGHGRGRRRGPAPRRAHRGDERRGLRRPVHREAAVRRLVDRHRGGRRPRDGARAARGEPAPRRTGRSSSRSAPTFATSRSRCGPTPRSSSRRSSDPCDAASGGEILDYADKYVAGEGMAAAPRELPARAQRRDRRSRSVRRRRTHRRRPASCGASRASTSSRATDELYVNEINTIPGSLSRYLFVDPPPRASSSCSTTSWHEARHGAVRTAT